MPFTKITSGPNKGKYRSDSGKIYTEEQLRLYYATHGFKDEDKRTGYTIKSNRKKK